MDVHHPVAQPMLTSLAHGLPHLALVARGHDGATARAMLAQLGFVRFEVRSHEAPAEELLDAAKRLHGAR